MADINKHTPGPWTPIEQGDADEFCLLANDKRWVIAFRQNGELSTEEERCNMKLISKAPEMFELLKQIRMSILINTLDINDLVIKINKIMERY